MSQRSGMSRLARLYLRVEQFRSVERRIAAMAVEEVAFASALHATSCASQIANGRAALGIGDRAEWTMAEIERNVAERQKVYLTALRGEREIILANAVEEHRESRLRMEQIERLATNLNTSDALDRARREQAQADDRFAARLACTRNNTLE